MMGIMLKPKILFEDTHLVVLSKPAGLLSQGESTGDANLVDWCREYFGRNYVGLVHRLDRNTSGLMVVAKRSKSAERLTEALKRGELIRIYHALLHGKLSAPAEWVHYLRKNETTNTVSVVRADASGAKEARLKVIPLVQYRDPSPLDSSASFVTLAEFHLDTGRSHQIRVQSSASGHPLVGDSKYGAPRSNLARPALHSAIIRFPHPMTKEPLEFTDPLPDYLAQFIKKLAFVR